MLLDHARLVPETPAPRARLGMPASEDTDTGVDKPGVVPSQRDAPGPWRGHPRT